MADVLDRRCPHGAHVESPCIACDREGELERLRGALNIDQTGLARALDEVRSIAGGHAWLGEPDRWGSYEYEDQTIEPGADKIHGGEPR